MNQDSVVSPFRTRRHAHARCLRDALDKAEARCEERGQRLTPLRRRVLELIWQDHEPVKAYDLLEQLRMDQAGAAPPTIYRALEFLLEQGLVHRLESLNAYVGCGEPGHDGAAQFLICETCGGVAELDDAEIGALIRDRARSMGFTPDQLTLEVRGACDHCGQGGRD